MTKALNVFVYLCLGALGYAVHQSGQSQPEGLFGDIGGGAFPSALGLALTACAGLGMLLEIKTDSATLKVSHTKIRSWFIMLGLCAALVTAWQLLGYFFVWLAVFLFTGFTLNERPRSVRSLSLSTLLSLTLSGTAYWLFAVVLGIPFG